MNTARLAGFVAFALLCTAAPPTGAWPDDRTVAKRSKSGGDRARKKALKKAKKRAKRYEKKAKKAYARKRWDDAIVAFELAHQARPKPQYLFNIGRCHEKKGDLFRAMEYVQAYVDTVEDEEEREDAVETYNILRGKLLKTRGELSLESEPSGAVVLIEGRDGAKRQGTTPYLGWLEAGPWSVRVSLDGYADAEDRVVVRVGAAVSRSVDLKRPAVEPKPKPKPKPKPVVEADPVAEPAPEPEAPPQEAASGMGGWIALAAGGALLAGGAVFGVLSSQAAADVEGYHDEPGSAWKGDAQDAIDAADSRALTANVLLGAGAVAAATGVVLLLLDGGGETDEAAARLVPAPGGLALTFGGLR